MAENNTEVTKVAINDIGTEEDFIKAVDSTIKNFDDGDLVEGTVVKIDHDEVPSDSVQEACPVRARLGRHREDQGS